MKFKKGLCFIIVLIILCSVTFSTTIATGDQTDDRTLNVTFVIGSPHMTVNGVPRLIDQEGSVPFISNNSTLVPLRALFDAFSIDTEWDSGKITGTRANTKIRLTIGDRVAYRNDRAFFLDAPPVIANNRTMVPLRFVVECLGAKVEWISETRTVNITYAPLFIELRDIRINIGDTLERVNSVLGYPSRIDPSNSDFEWYVYNKRVFI